MEKIQLELIINEDATAKFKIFNKSEKDNYIESIPFPLDITTGFHENIKSDIVDNPFHENIDTTDTLNYKENNTDENDRELNLPLFNDEQICFGF